MTWRLRALKSHEYLYYSTTLSCDDTKKVSAKSGDRDCRCGSELHSGPFYRVLEGHARNSSVLTLPIFSFFKEVS